MNVTELESEVLALPVPERRQFVHWVEEHREEILPDEDAIHPTVQAEILRRRDEVLAHPELMEPWDGTVNKARELLNEIRRKKAQSR